MVNLFCYQSCSARSRVLGRFFQADLSPKQGGVHTRKIKSQRLYRLFFFHAIYYLRSFSLSFLVVTQIGGHIAGSSPPFPLRFVPCIFVPRKKISALASLVDLRRTVLTHARRSQQLLLIPFFFLERSGSLIITWDMNRPVARHLQCFTLSVCRENQLGKKVVGGGDALVIMHAVVV